jgi:hypothetical protein
MVSWEEIYPYSIARKPKWALYLNIGRKKFKWVLRKPERAPMGAKMAF